MPNMADITVKKADNTTNVVYSALTPSAGDKVAAKWRANAASSVPSHRPLVELTSRDNGAKDGRRVVMTGKYPILAMVGGVETVTAIVPFEFSGLVPQNVDTAQVSEAIAQMGNIFVSALIRQCYTDGYAPT